MLTFAALFVYKVEMKRYQQGIADNQNQTGVIELGSLAKEVVSKTSEVLFLLLTAAAFRMYLL
jgi:hypothetical protein